MHRDTAVYPEDIHPSLENLKAQARMKEFQIKKLIEISHFVQDITPAMLQAAKEVVEAQQSLQMAQEVLHIKKDAVARLLR